MFKKLICVLIAVVIIMATVFVYAESAHNIIPSNEMEPVQELPGLLDITAENTSGQGLEIFKDAIIIERSMLRSATAVSTRQEFEDAVKDSNVTEINLNSKAIALSDIVSANRTTNLTIYGGGLSAANSKTPIGLNLPGITLTLNYVSVHGNYIDGNASGPLNIISAGSLVVNNCTFRNMFTGSYGSVLSYVNSLTMTNTNIFFCNASTGGILRLSGPADISNCNIYKNYIRTASHTSADIIRVNPVSSYGTTPVTVNLTDVKIYSNYVVSSSSSKGSAVRVDGAFANANFTRCEIYDHNLGQTRGGAMYLANGGMVTIKDSNIYNNSADIGGAIYVDYEGSYKRIQLQITNTKIINNTATSNGGGIGFYTDNLDFIKIYGVTFSGNSASKTYVWDYALDGIDYASLTHKNNIINTTYTSPFTNAYNNADIMYTNGVEYNPVTVSFDPQGGNDVSAMSANLGLKYGALSTPSRTGYNFDGWHTAATGGELVTSDTIVANSSAHTLYAHWSPLTYTVSFNTQGGTTVPNQTVTYGGIYGTFPLTTRAGYSFIGWYTAATGGAKVETNTTVNNSNHTVFAQWSANPYTVSFSTLGGTDVPNQTIYHDGTYGILPVTTRTGYAFTGWYTNAADGMKVETNATVNNSNHTLFARWSANPYTLSFDSRCDSTVPNKTIFHDGIYDELPVVERTGYSFNGWFTSPTGGIKAEASAAVINGPHTLFAQWQANTYTVRFDSRGGTVMNSRTITFDVPYGSLPEPERAGYVFQGWFTDMNEIKIEDETIVFIPESHTLYAQWKGIPVPIQFNTNGGGAIDGITVEFGEAYGVLETPIRKGYTFLGWTNPLYEGYVESNISVDIMEPHILNAEWRVNQYIVSFDTNGADSETPNPITVTYDEPYRILPDNPVKDKWVFKGWFLDAECTEEITRDTIVQTDYNHTLYAKWTAAKHISFYYNDGTRAVYDKTIVGYGDSLAEPLEPSRTGYVFNNWQLDNGNEYLFSSKVTTDLDLYAQWVWDGLTPLHQVAFYRNDGSFLTHIILIAGQGGFIHEPVEPIREGFDFVGWFMDAACVIPFDFDTHTIESELSLYAGWQHNSSAPYINVKFYWNDGSFREYTTIEVKQGYRIIEPLHPIRPGYELHGWYTETDTMTAWRFTDAVTNEMSLYAGWNRADEDTDYYTVTFKYNDSTFRTYTAIDVLAGEPVPLPVNLIRIGFDFTGWYYDGERSEIFQFNTPVTKDLILYAGWDLKDGITYHTVDCHYNDGSFQLYTRLIVPDGSTFTSPIKPERNGFEFAGWYYDAACSSLFNEAVLIHENLNLYAHWQRDSSAHPDSYNTVDFYWNDGSFRKYTSIEVKAGSLLHRPVEPLRAGYYFDGWFKDEECINVFDFDAPIVANQNLYAKWSELIGYKYQDVSFHWNDGSYRLYTSITVTLSAAVTEPMEPQRLGFTFTGWYMDEGCNLPFSFSTPIVAHLELYAGWNALSETEYHTVCFLLNDNTFRQYTAISVADGGLVPCPAAPVRPGFSFDGWHYDETGKTTYNFDLAVSAPIILYAKWDKEGVLDEYHTVIFLYNDNSFREYTRLEVHDGGSAGDIVEPERAGYIFSGWYYDVEITAPYDLLKSVHENITLYAGWKKRESEHDYYRATFHYNDGSFLPYTSIEMFVGERVAVPVDPIRPGYIFTGWFSEKDMLIPYDFCINEYADLSLYAGWKHEFTGGGSGENGQNSENSQGSIYDYYNVNFHLNDGTHRVYTIIEVWNAQTVRVPAAPERNGFDFGGWFLEVDCKNEFDFDAPITKETHVYAQWTEFDGLNYITVDFQLNDGSFLPYCDVRIPVNQRVDEPAPPYRKGFDFIGWYTESSCDNIFDFSAILMGNTTLYAGWVETHGESGSNPDSEISYYDVWYYNFMDKSKLYTVIRVMGGDTAKEPCRPVNQDYAFVGWYNDETNTLWNFNEPVYNTTTLYARWTKYTTGADIENNNGTNSRDALEAENASEIDAEEDIMKQIPHRSYISGYGDATVRPDNPITRAEIASLVYRMQDNRVKTVSGSIAPDVDETAWYAIPVSYLYETNVIVGYEDGTFKPSAKITRAELLVIISRIASNGTPKYNAEAIEPFDDVSGHWAYEYIHSARTNHYITGYGDGTFRPDSSISRAEAITVINKFLQRDYKNAALAEVELPYADLSSFHWAYGEIMEASVYHHCIVEEMDKSCC